MLSSCVYPGFNIELGYTFDCLLTRYSQRILDEEKNAKSDNTEHPQIYSKMGQIRDGVKNSFPQAMIKQSMLRS